jgi:hypothetical protein
VSVSGKLVGYEASFKADAGTYADFVAQLKVDDAGGTHRKSRNPDTQLVLSCGSTPPALGSIGDTLFADIDGDGVQGTAETGIAGVTITLTRSNGSTRTAVTDANGTYKFTGLAAGAYTVTVGAGTGTPLAGWTNTADPDGVNNSTTSLTLGAGENNLVQDFGYKPPAGGVCTDNAVVDFEGFAAGTVITTQIPGMTISATGGVGKAMIFDSAVPTGGDTDLKTPGYHASNTVALGKVLVIAENNSTPDDNATGGTLRFQFAEAQSVTSVRLLDIEETGGTITAIRANGTSVVKSIPAKGDNRVQSVSVDATDVVVVALGDDDIAHRT